MSSGGDAIKTLAPAAVAVGVMFIPGMQGLGPVAYAIAVGAATATSLALNAAMPAAKPKLPKFELGSLASGGGVRNVTEPITTRKLVYGRCRCGDARVFLHSTGGKDYLHMLVMLAGHPIDAVEEIWVNDEVVEFDPVTHAALPVGGTYNRSDLGAAPFLWVWTGDGTPAGDADLLAAIRSGCPDVLDTDHRWTGCAKLYARLRWGNGSAWTSGIPNFTAVVRGKKVYDPRTAATAWSANASLCQADYISDPMGMNEGWSRVDETSLTTAANVSDEAVALADGGTESRYEVNGIIDTADSPEDNLGKLLSASGGQAVYTGGKWELNAAAWAEPDPADELTLDDIVGPLRVVSRIGRKDLCNGIKGIFRDPDQNWQPVDAPPVQVADWLAEDQGEELWKDVELPFTTSGSMAQRLFRIELEKVRRQITLYAPCSHRALRYKVGQVIPVTLDRFGWSLKSFVVTGWQFLIRTEGEAPTLGCDLVLRETDENVYAWSAADEQSVNPAVRTTLPNARSVGLPSNLAVTETLYLSREGAGVKAKAIVSWDLPDDAFVQAVEVEYNDASTSVWNPAGSTGQTSLDIPDISPGTYNFRVRSRNYYGAYSIWVGKPKQIYGLAADPANVAGFSLAVLSDQAHLSWDPATDLDVREGGRVRIRHTRDTVSPSWGSSQDIGPHVPGKATSVVLPAVPGVYLAKFVDTTGHESPVEAAAYCVTATSFWSRSGLASNAQHPGFTGTKSGMYVNDAGSLALAGVGYVDDQGYVDDIPDWDAMGGLPSNASYLFDSPLDLGSVRTCRLTADVRYAAGVQGDWIDQRGYVDDWPSVDGDSVNDVDAQAWVKTTDDDPSASDASWGDFQRLLAGDVTCRGIWPELLVTNGSPTHQILVSNLNVTAETVS